MFATERVSSHKHLCWLFSFQPWSLLHNHSTQNALQCASGQGGVRDCELQIKTLSTSPIYTSSSHLPGPIPFLEWCPDWPIRALAVVSCVCVCVWFIINSAEVYLASSLWWYRRKRACVCLCVGCPGWLTHTLWLVIGSFPLSVSDHLLLLKCLRVFAC